MWASEVWGEVAKLPNQPRNSNTPLPAQEAKELLRCFQDVCKYEGGSLLYCRNWWEPKIPVESEDTQKPDSPLTRTSTAPHLFPSWADSSNITIWNN